MEQIKLEVQLRKEAGSSEVKELRRAGFIPGVVYGGADKPVSIKLMRKDFDGIMRHHHGESILFQVEISDNGKKVGECIALTKETYYNPVTDFVDHIDLQRISMDKEITFRVAIHVKGEAIGLKKPGATLEHGLRDLEVICLPKDIPQSIVIDVTNLDTHHAIHVSDLALPSGVRTKMDPGAVVVAVVFSTREEAPAAAGEEAAAPTLEVLKEKPKDAADAAGAAKPAAGAAKPAAGAAKPAAPAKK
ncbi:MAG: 50S ribosomal protein L25 [Candidatus Omnitrophica bacterium]|nr:50S ribosomal protein L25 [Candidatus Omnitrophota bacterium]